MENTSNQPNKRYGVALFLVFGLLLGFHEPAFAIDIDAAWLSANGPAPYILNQRYATYNLRTHVTTPGTAFVLTNEDITFNLNGNTITYNNAPKIIIPNGDFENGTTGWTGFAGGLAVNAGTLVQPVSVFSGNNALRVSFPTANQTIRTNNFVNLEPNTTYSLSAMMANDIHVQGQNSSLNTAVLFVRLAGTNIEASATGQIWRGFIYKNVVFKTGPAPESYQIEVGVRDAAGVPSSFAYIDDVRIQRYRNHGIAVGVPGWQNSLVPDINVYGTSNRSTIKNGNIVQGQDGSDYSYGVFVGALNRDVEINNLNITLYGANSKNINVHENSHRVLIHHNTLYNNTVAITSRDHFDGTVINIYPSNYGNEIYSNRIEGGSQIGIYARIARIYDNVIALKTRYTNDFAIIGSGEIFNNTINCGSGDYSCRGIGGGSGAIIHGNTITVQHLRRNQEYNGCSIGGAYGMQLEAAANLNVYNNHITAIADVCDAVAFRTNPADEGGGGGNMHIHGNVFIGKKVGNANAYTLKVDGIQDATASMQFENNSLITNSRWFLGGQVKDLQLTSNQFGILQGGGVPSNPLVASYWPVTNENAVVDLKFIDNIYLSPEARNSFETASFRTSQNNLDPRSSHINAWTITVLAQNGSAPVQNAAVVIRDQFGSTVFSGVTNAQGLLTRVLEETRDVGGTKTNFNPYSISVTHPNTSIVITNSFTANQPKTVVFNFGMNQPPQVDAGGDQTVAISAGARMNATIVDEGSPSIQWQGSGPGTITFSDENISNPIVQFSEMGTYVLEITATDGFGLSASDNVTVYVTADNPDNIPPTIYVGPNRTIDISESLVIDATVTDDGLPSNTLILTWEKIMGPGTAIFILGNNTYQDRVEDAPEDISIRFTLQGTYKLRLTAHDGEYGRSHDLTVVVTSQDDESNNNGGDNNGPPTTSHQSGNILSPQIHEVIIPCNNSIRITDRRGNEILSRSCANNQVTWSGYNNSGAKVASGIYYVIEDGINPRKYIVIR